MKLASTTAMGIFIELQFVLAILLFCDGTIQTGQSHKPFIDHVLICTAEPDNMWAVLSFEIGHKLSQKLQIKKEC